MSSTIHTLLLLAHLLGAIVWIGGMVFAHFALRPAAVALLPPPQRLPLMSAALGRFFRLVAVAIAALLVSGFGMWHGAGTAQAPLGWWVMGVLGLVMTANFVVIAHVLHPRLRKAVAEQAWPAGAKALDGIRRLVVVNLALGALTVAAAVTPRL